VPLDPVGADGWAPHTFVPEQRRAGILTFAAFLMLDPTHEGRSSPTIRGKNVREVFMCQPVPAPPPNVDFSAVQNTHDALHKTARDRLEVHRTAPACNGCHKIMDPIGLSMENYNAIGAYRTEENGALIDASGTLENATYHDAVGVGQILHDSPATTSCIVRRVYEYGAGRSITAGDGDWLRSTGQGFAQDGYSFPRLMRRIATSSAFGAVSNVDVASSK
jgi:hypothetical protein